MNILIIANVDHSGAGYALREAINNTTNHNALAVSFKRSWINYPVNIFNPTQEMFKKYVEWADVLNLHDEALQYVPHTKKPVVITYHGTWYRSQYEKINKRDKRRGFVPTALTLDLAIHGPRWIGRAIPDLKKMHKPKSEFTVVHAPTQRHRKGTNTVIKAFENIDANLLLIEKQPYQKCLKLKAQGHVLIDQVGSKALGYGTNALEAWAMGMPVISSAPVDVVHKMINLFGYCPFLAVYTQDELIRYIEKLRDNQEFYDQWAKLGNDFINTYHSEGYVAREFVSACLSARDK